MSFYPSKVQIRFELSRNVGRVDGENGIGKNASFVCGSFIGFSIQVEPESKKVVACGFQTNGCGFMIAAADALAEAVKDRSLGELHGLNIAELLSTVYADLGIFDDNRWQCAECCITALRAAFADHRTRQIEKFRGEKALICTCFGVSEETIEMHIEDMSLKTVDEVASVCNAGSGCGSCRMLIQEMLAP